MVMYKKNELINAKALATFISGFSEQIVGGYSRNGLWVDTTLNDSIAAVYQWCGQLKMISLYRLCGIEAFNLTSKAGRKQAEYFVEQSNVDLDKREASLCNKLFRKVRWLNDKCRELTGDAFLTGWITEDDAFDLADEWIDIDASLRSEASNKATA